MVKGPSPGPSQRSNLTDSEAILLASHRVLERVASPHEVGRACQTAPGSPVTAPMKAIETAAACVKSYSKTGGECGIRTRGGGFADLCLTTWLTRHRSQSDSLVGTRALPLRLSTNLSSDRPGSLTRRAHNHATCGGPGLLSRP